MCDEKTSLLIFIYIRLICIAVTKSCNLQLGVQTIKYRTIQYHKDIWQLIVNYNIRNMWLKAEFSVERNT